MPHLTGPRAAPAAPQAAYSPVVVVLREIDICPMTGFPDQPWLDDPDLDAFTKSARRVCELYQEALAPARLPSRAPRVLAGLLTHDRDDVSVVVHVDPTTESQPVTIHLPAGVAALSPQARGLLVLDAVHGAVTRLAQSRGWPPEPVDAARRHCLDQSLVYRWTSPWTASPGRRLRARAVYRLEDDGYGRVHLEVSDRDGAAVGRSEEALAFTTSEGFRRSAATLRWTDRDSVALVPYAGLFGAVDGLLPWTAGSPWPAPGPMAPSPTAPGSAAPTRPSDLDVQRPPVRVVGRGATALEQPSEIIVVGGGPINGVPRTYRRTLDDLLAQLRGPDWQQWWSAADLAILEIWYWFDVPDRRIVVRRSRNKLIAKIERPTGSMRRSDDPAALARQDVEDLLATVRTRIPLAEPPPLLMPRAMPPR